jgi:hypothetical protein
MGARRLTRASARSASPTATVISSAMSNSCPTDSLNRFGFTGDVPDPERFGTVENLFAIVHDAVGRDAARINADYDPELGHLTNFLVDYDERLADEERGVAIFELTPSS